MPEERAAADSVRASAVLAPDEIVERQIDAFNRRSLDDFMACFADSARLVLDGEVAASGREALREVYGPQFAGAAVRATVLSRITQAEWVVDRERADGPDGSAMTVLALYRTRDGLIDRVQLMGQQVGS
jgi:hypothetical protein